MAIVVKPGRYLTQALGASEERGFKNVKNETGKESNHKSDSIRAFHARKYKDANANSFVMKRGKN